MLRFCTSKSTIWETGFITADDDLGRNNWMKPVNELFQKPEKELMKKLGKDIVRSCPFFKEEEKRLDRMIEWNELILSQYCIQYNVP